MVRRPRPALVVSALAAGSALVGLTACNGPTNPQAKVHASNEGISAMIGDIKIRNATVLLGEDGEARLGVVLFNQGAAPDTLSAVTPGATGAFGSAAFPSPGKVQIAGLAANGVTQTPTSDRSASSPASVALTSDGGIFLNRAPAFITLKDVASNARTGGALPVTFSFSTAGSITLQVPIVHAPAASEGPEATSSPSASN